MAEGARLFSLFLGGRVQAIEPQLINLRDIIELSFMN